MKEDLSLFTEVILFHHKKKKNWSKSHKIEKRLYYTSIFPDKCQQTVQYDVPKFWNLVRMTYSYRQQDWMEAKSKL